MSNLFSPISEFPYNNFSLKEGTFGDIEVYPAYYFIDENNSVFLGTYDSSSARFFATDVIVLAEGQYAEIPGRIYSGVIGFAPYDKSA